MMDQKTQMSYGDVLEYLSDREGDSVIVSSFPSFHVSESGEWGSGSTILGLEVSAIAIAKVEAVKPYEEQWLDGRAGARIRLCDESSGDDRGGLVLTREWFGGAHLDENHAHLTIYVRANTGAPPLYAPVGEEPEPEEGRDVPMHDLVGWGFAFDFDGSPPVNGRWSR